MAKQKELEVVQHATMNYLELFLVEITSRQPHGHSDLEIGVILKGSMTLFIDHIQYHLKKGDIYIINRYQIHSLSRTDEENLILAFQAHVDFYRRLDYRLTYLRFDNNIIHSGHLHRILSEQLFSCASVYFSPDPYRELECASILLHVLHTLLRQSVCTITSEREYRAVQSSTLRINRITEYIHEHHAERISLHDIAELEHITAYHASHVIKSALGISFQDYLNSTRFEHALQLLSQTDLSILDVCMESGFSSSRYLNQMFERNLGCTAKEYAKKKLKPVLKETALPASDQQRRHSYENSAFLFQSITHL